MDIKAFYQRPWFADAEPLEWQTVLTNVIQLAAWVLAVKALSSD